MNLVHLAFQTVLPAVKQEPEETEIKKSEAIFKPPPLPEPEVLSDLLHKWSLSKRDQLFFMQLPDSLPGQPPTKEHRPVKTEVQSEDGQSVLLKTENQVDTEIKTFAFSKSTTQCLFQELEMILVSSLINIVSACF